MWKPVEKLRNRAEKWGIWQKKMRKQAKIYNLLAKNILKCPYKMYYLWKSQKIRIVWCLQRIFWDWFWKPYKILIHWNYFRLVTLILYSAFNKTIPVRTQDMKIGLNQFYNISSFALTYIGYWTFSPILRNAI